MCIFNIEASTIALFCTCGTTLLLNHSLKISRTHTDNTKECGQRSF